MKTVLRYFASYVLDFFRERVTGEDFCSERAIRVLVAPGTDARTWSTARKIFPEAELFGLNNASSLFRVRAARFDAACICMAGGGLKERLVALVSGARHKLLIPSPDYVYRFGMRGGCAALVWAVVDHLLLAPLGLVWLVAVACWMYARGLPQRAMETENPDPPGKILVVCIAQTECFLYLLKELRERWPQARVYAVVPSPEVEKHISEHASRVLLSSRIRGQELLKRVRHVRPDLAIVASDADRGITLGHFKAMLLARLSGARRRFQWKPSDLAPGRPLAEAVISRLVRRLRSRERNS